LAQSEKLLTLNQIIAKTDVEMGATERARKKLIDKGSAKEVTDATGKRYVIEGLVMGVNDKTLMLQQSGLTNIFSLSVICNGPGFSVLTWEAAFFSRSAMTSRAESRSRFPVLLAVRSMPIRGELTPLRKSRVSHKDKICV
jgi:hypothetical protein